MAVSTAVSSRKADQPITGHPAEAAYGLQTTNELLARIAYQLEQQSAELQQIRRSAGSCDHNLSIARRCLQQLVSLTTVTAEACCRVALAAAEFLNTAATAQNASRLQMGINSGRLLMLVTLLLLSAFSSFNTVHRQCARQLMQRVPFWSRLPVPAPVLQLLQQPKVDKGMLGLVKGSYAGCIISTGGCYVFGLLLLLAWTWRAWNCNPASQTRAAPAASTPVDPLLSLLLTALPVSNSNMPMLAIVLPAALYEAVLGSIAVAAVLGRWCLWLLLWEAWLWCCYYSCSSMQQTGQHSELVIEHQHVYQGPQLVQQCTGYPVIQYDSVLVNRSKIQPQQQLQLQAAPKQQGNAAFKPAQQQHTARLAGLSNKGTQWQIALAALQLLLPVVMATAAAWR